MTAPMNQRRAKGTLRILHVITRLVVGGAQENTLITVRRLRDLGYEVGLAAGPETGAEGALPVPPGIRFHEIPTLVREIRPVADVRALWDLYRVMRDGSYDVVHTHTSKAGVLGRIAARWANVPLVVHTPHGHVYHGYAGWSGSRLFAWIERWLAGWTDVLVALTESEMREHLTERVGKPDQWRVIPSGVDLAAYRGTSSMSRAEVGLPLEGFVVGCVARLVPVKGVGDLIRAVALLKRDGEPVYLAVVGDGPMRGELEALAEDLGVGAQVGFLGLRRDVEQLLPLFDAMVLPSYNEGMGRVLVEAQAGGVPVVGTRVGGIVDVVRDGETGLLVPPGAPQALAAAIARLRSDASLRQRMAAAARQFADERFSAERMLRELCEVYERGVSLRASAQLVNAGREARERAETESTSGDRLHTSR